MNFNNMTRDDLIGEIIALQNTIDKRVEKETKREKNKLKQQKRELELLCAYIAEKEHDAAVEFLRKNLKDRLFCYRGIFSEFGIFKAENEIPLSLSIKLNELKESIEQIKKGM